MMTMNQLIEAAEKHARNYLINNEGAQLSPSILMENEEESLIIVAPWGNTTERSMALNIIRFSMKVKNIKQYSVVSESWMSTERKGMETGLMPSQRQDRREVIMIVAVNEEQKKSIMWEIKRNDKAVIIDFINKEELNDKHIGGDLANLLED